LFALGIDQSICIWSVSAYSATIIRSYHHLNHGQDGQEEEDHQQEKNEKNVAKHNNDTEDVTQYLPMEDGKY
jgi:hypothetical protein